MTGAIQFGGEFSITADHRKRREKKALNNNAQNLSALCGLCGKFLPDEKYLPPF
jgi:hypothetical protein